MNYAINGGKTLSGTVTTNTSKNATVALLAASLLNRGTTTLKNVPDIEDGKRIYSVMESMGVKLEQKGKDLIITPPKKLKIEKIDKEAAESIRSILMFISPLTHYFEDFLIPRPGGCRLGERSVSAHADALRSLGIKIKEDKNGMFRVNSKNKKSAEVAMLEASDTGVENALLAAAKIEGKTTIKFATSNYMVQDLCVFLESCGVKIEGVGTTTLTVHGVADINTDLVGYPSEDPIESMFFISLAATTNSEITIKRCPIDFLELELMTLEKMGFKYKKSKVYLSENGRTKLVDITTQQSSLKAALEKIAPRPYPGINIDNLPFFVPIATQAKGTTLIHDWVYENRAIYYMELTKLGASMIFADPHRVFVRGKTAFRAGEVICPPALRPAILILIGMLAAEGKSVLRNVYPIQRGYENIHNRLKALGADIKIYNGA